MMRCSDDISVNNSFSLLSVSFDSLAPARLALRANLRLLYLIGPAFSIVVNLSQHERGGFSMHEARQISKLAKYAKKKVAFVSNLSRKQAKSWTESESSGERLLKAARRVSGSDSMDIIYRM